MEALMFAAALHALQSALAAERAERELAVEQRRAQRAAELDVWYADPVGRQPNPPKADR
jgi:hypothetical protein